MARNCFAHCVLRNLTTIFFVFLAGLMLDAAAQDDNNPASFSITGSPDNSVRTIFPHSRFPLAQSLAVTGAVDRGAVMERMVLVLGPRPGQEEELHALLEKQRAKGSANYHKWLTPDEFGAKFGPAPEDIEQVKGWLQQQGFSVGAVAHGGRWIEFSGTSGQVEAAFQTQMRLYEVGGVTHMANASDISVPAALSSVVQGVLSLHDFFSKPMVTQRYQIHRAASGEWLPGPDFTIIGQNGPFHFLTPADYTSIYNLGPLYKAEIDGLGQTIAIVARSNIDLSDVETFRQIFNLPDNDPKIIVNQSSSGIFSGNDQLEATLDVEWAGAIAPRATIDLVVNPSTATTDGVALSAMYIVDNDLAPIMSVSFGECESALGAENAFYNSLWQQASAEGISVFVSSGDNGSAGCDNPNDPNNKPANGGLAVSGLASTPFDTAVGGTEFHENENDSVFWSAANGAAFESAVGYIPEMVWNESCDPTQAGSPCVGGNFSLFAGSGGVSTLYGKPSWQSTSIAGVPNDGKRDIPDVSLAAAGGHDGYLMCFEGSCDTTTDNNVLENATVIGGTSASSPSLAGMMALVNQKVGGRQGLANYIFYQLAVQETFANCNSSNETNPLVSSSCIFNDVTAGNNGVPGQAGFSAGTGYDLATGLGSVNAANLAQAWSNIALVGSATTLSAPAAAIQHGQSVAVTINVAATSGGGVPTGNFSLLTDKGSSVGSGTLIGGSFSGSFSNLPGGQYKLTAHYPGDGTFGPSDSAPVSVNITPENSSVVLTAYTNGVPLSGQQVVFGQFVALDAVVASASTQGGSTGSVTFTDIFNGNITQLGTVALNPQGMGELDSFGFFNAPINLAVGTHSITASYSGDSSLNASRSLPAVVTVTKGNSSATLAYMPSTIVSTQQLLVHVYVAGSAGGVTSPTGKVQVFDGSTSIGSPIQLASPFNGTTPQADLQVSLAPGNHAIMAQYLGDTDYNASSGTPDLFNSRTVNVIPGNGQPVQVALTPNVSSPTVTQLVNYSVRVTSAQSTPPLTGTVQLFTSLLGPVGQAMPLQNGTVSIPYQWEFAGPRVLAAQYSGDANYAAGESLPLAVTVSRATPSITLSTSSANVNSGGQMSLTAMISVLVQPITGILVDPSGAVQFFDSVGGATPQPVGAPINLLPVHLGVSIEEGYKAVAALQISPGDGTHTFTAQYLGDSGFNSVASGPVTVVVGLRRASLTTLTVDTAAPSVDQTVNFNMTVAAAQGTDVPTGTVQLMSHTLGRLGSASLQNGTAIIQVQWSAGGFQSVFAQYSGDGSFASSGSVPVMLTVPTFELFDSSNLLPITAGGSAAVIFTVTPIAGFSASTKFTCGPGIPAGATCSISPSTVTPNGAPVNTLFVLSTTAPSQTANRYMAAKWNVWWILSTGAGIVGLAFIALPGRKARQQSAVVLIIASLFTGAIGCGGGGGSPGGPNPNPTPTPIVTPSPVATPTPTPGGLTPTSTAITTSLVKAASGDSVTLSAAIGSSASIITGTVIFLDGSTQVGQPVAVSNGHAQLQVNTLSVGTHSITARYSGDLVNGGSTSSMLNQTITGTVQFPVTATSGKQTKTILMNVLIE